MHCYIVHSFWKTKNEEAESQQVTIVELHIIKPVAATCGKDAAIECKQGYESKLQWNISQ